MNTPLRSTFFKILANYLFVFLITGGFLSAMRTVKKYMGNSHYPVEKIFEFEGLFSNGRKKYKSIYVINYEKNFLTN